MDRHLDHMLGAEHVGLDRLEGVLLDHIDVLHRRGVDHDVDLCHRVSQAGRVADVAGEDLTVTLISMIPIAAGGTYQHFRSE